MTGTIDGQAVVWGELGHAERTRTFGGQAGFQELQRVATEGPGQMNLRASGILNPSADARERAEAIHNLLRIAPFSLAYDASGILFGSSYAWVKAARQTWDVHHNVAEFGFDYDVVGTPDTHSVGVVATARQIPNDFSQAGVTAVRVPANATPLGETIDDVGRDVIQTPTAYATLDGSYLATGIKRNGLAPIECPITAPADWASEWTRVIPASGPDIQGSLRLPADGTTFQNVAQNLVLDTAGSKITFSDRIGAATDQDLILPAYTSAGFAFNLAGLPSTIQRRVARLGNGFAFSVQDNGNTLLYPIEATTFRLPGSATRSLGTGIYYHQVKADTYLVGSKDFAIDGSGNVTWTGEATFSLIFSDLAGADLLLRLREGLMEVLTNYVATRRTR